MVKVLNKLDDLNDNKETIIRKETPDQLFGKLIGQSIAEIPDSYKTELLKIQMQEIILETKFSASQYNIIVEINKNSPVNKKMSKVSNKNTRKRTKTLFKFTIFLVFLLLMLSQVKTFFRDGCRVPGTFKMEFFVKIVQAVDY